MAQYVNQSEQVIHGINAPVVNYGQIQVSKNLLDKMPVPDTDVGGKWTSAIPGAVASFGQGVMAGVKQRAAEADAQQKTALQNAKNEFAKVIRKYTAQQLQSGGPLSTYENNVRVAMDSFSGVVPEDDLYRIARDNSSGELTRAIEARKQLQKNEITDADTKVKDARSKYSWMQDWSYEDVLGFVTNQEYTKDNLFRYNGLYKSNNKDVSAFTMAVNSLSENLQGNFIQDANAFLEGEKDAVLDEAWLQEYKNNVKNVLVAAKLDPRIVDAGIDKGINASLLQTIVNGNEKLLNLKKSQQERELSLLKTSGERDFYEKNPGMIYVDLAIGTSGRQTIAQAKMMEDPDAKARIEGLIQKAATSPITDPTERKQLIENDKVLPVYVKALRSKTEPMDNTLDSTLAYNVLGLMNTNNSSNPIKTEKDAETVIHNNSMLDLNSMKAEAEKLIKTGNPKDIEKGNEMLAEISVNKSQTFAAKLVSPGYFSNANGLRKLLGSAQTYFDPVSKKVVEGENFLRFDPTTQEFYLAAPKGFIATSADKINNLTGLYEQYLKNTNGLLKYAMQEDKDIDGMYVAQFYGIPVQARKTNPGKVLGIDISNLDALKEDVTYTITEEPEYSFWNPSWKQTKAYYPYAPGGQDDELPRKITRPLRRSAALEEAMNTVITGGQDLTGKSAIGNAMNQARADQLENTLNSEPLTATASVSSASPVGGASVSYKEPGQSLKYSDFSWSPEIEMFSDIIEDIESKGKQEAVSSKGAKGRMQLMPDTYKMVAKKYNLPADGIDDPELNKIAGTLFFQDLVNKYNDINKTLAAYNWGPGYVDEAVKEYGINWYAGAKKKGITWNGKKRYLPKETQNYLAQFHNKLENGAW